MEDLKLAILIDADNISPKYVKVILDEAASFGVAACKRIYGDWSDVRLKSWKDALLNNSIIPIQQYSYTTGKNATDSAMIIDAMDLLYGGNLDGFCIVSSDSDFTRLAARLREAGKLVIGMGESKALGPFVKACDQFKYLDLILDHGEPEEPSIAAPVAETNARATAGDDAAGVTARYGSVLVIEPEQPLYVAASTAQAYDDDDNRYLHAGETLYLKCGNEKGTGRVASVSGKDYIVEILTGSFDVGDTVRCFRESSTPSDSETGRGKVKRYDDVNVVSDGRVAKVHVKPGDTVKVGDLLFEMIDAQSAKDASPVIAAPVSGAVSAVYVTSGTQVYRGALLCEIADLSTLELSLEVDELDIDRVKIGDVLSFTLDAYAGQTFSGAVTEIRPIGSARQNATYFDVRVAAPQGVTLLPGMNATVTIGE